MATILENEAAWSTTAATNASVDTGINWAENQDAATVNNSARGMMAARAKARLDLGGALVAGGTGDALTVTTNQVLSSAHLAAGLRLLVRATATNTIVLPTLAPDGLTAIPIRRADGSALTAGSITSGMLLDLVYNAVSTDWRLVNFGSLAASLPSSVSFSAYLPAGSFVMASATPYFIPFNTVFWNFASLFNGSPGNYLWTPPAGRCMLSAAYYATGQTAANYQLIMIYKNGARRFANQVYPAAAAGSVAISVIDACNGTDYYQVVGQAISAAGATVSTDNSLTYFIGSMI